MIPKGGLAAPAEMEDEQLEGETPEQELQEGETPEEELQEEAGEDDGGAIEDENANAEAASEQEQQQFSQVYEMVAETLHGEGAQATLKGLKARKDDLPQAIGETIASLVTGIEAAVTQRGGSISEAVLLEVAMEIGEDLIDICEAAALVPEDEEKQAVVLEEAMMIAIAIYGDKAAQSGKVDRNQAKQQLQQMVGSGQAGEFGKQLSQLMGGAA